MIHGLPAHTDGDTVVHITNRNTFHMGDTFFNGTYPFIDVDSAGSFDGLIAAGLSADEVVAAGVTSEWDATMGAGFMNPENFTRLAYRSLTE